MCGFIFYTDSVKVAWPFNKAARSKTPLLIEVHTKRGVMVCTSTYMKLTAQRACTPLDDTTWLRV